MTADSTGSRIFVVIRGVIYSAGFIALWVWLGSSMPALDDRWPFRLPLWLRPLGVALTLAGAALAGTCIATFVTTGRGTPAPFDPPREFVATGPYRYVRNPMYVGAAAVILGVGLAMSSLSVILFAAGFLLAMHLLVVLYEEPTLSERFGASYLEYRSKVDRWRIRAPRSGAPGSRD